MLPKSAATVQDAALKQRLLRLFEVSLPALPTGAITRNRCRTCLLPCHCRASSEGATAWPVGRDRSERICRTKKLGPTTNSA